MADQIPNPWRTLGTSQPYVLSEDAAQVEAFNFKHPDDQFTIRRNALPEPYLGSPTAPIVLLSLNSGFDERDPGWHAKPEFADRNRRNLLHDNSLSHPFYLVDPGLVANEDRTDYWDKKLGPLIARFGPKLISANVLCVEFFPYHSSKFNHEGLNLPSQQYTFQLVRQALEHEALILLMRGRRLWHARIPGLTVEGRYYAARSPQNPRISEGNYPEGFHKAVAILEKKRAESARES